MVRTRRFVLVRAALVRAKSGLAPGQARAIGEMELDRGARKMKYRRFRGTLLALVVCVLAGCSGAVPPDQQEEGDVGKVADLVQTFSDLARDPEQFKTPFVDGKVPDEKTRKQYMKLYQQWNVEPMEPKVEGDRATIAIEVLDPQNPDTVAETVTWTAVKQGGEWKLEEAPLPSVAK